MQILSDAGALVGTWWNQVTRPQAPQGPQTQITVAPAALTARTDLDEAQQALGQPLPVVIGTGRVNGVYFIGGVETLATTTWTTTTSNTIPPGYVAVSGTMGGQTFLFGPGPRTTTTSTTTYDNRTLAGYVLAYDVFERGYDLIRLEIDGAVVFDAENSIPETTTFRFYGGRHTTVDPILTQIIGTNAGAYQNFVMIFIDGFPADSPPNISAVISNATESASTGGEIIGPSYDSASWAVYYGAYDPVEGLFYQYIPAASSVHGVDMLHTLSVDSLTEIARFPWPVASIPSPRGFCVLAGSGCMIASSETGTRTVGIVDLATGSVVDAATPGRANPVGWICSLDASGAFPGTWLAIGSYEAVVRPGTENTMLAVFDSAAGTLDLVTVGSVAIDYWVHACPGRVLSSTASFFVVDWIASLAQQNTVIKELTWNGMTVTTTTIYTVPSGYIRGIHYDADTGYLVVPVEDGSSHYVHIVNLSGALITSITTGTQLETTTTNGAFKSTRLFPAPGTALLYDLGGTRRVWVLDLTTFALAVYATAPGSNEIFNLVYDGNRNIWMADNAPATTVRWVVHGVATISPLLIDLEDIITDAMSLAGFGPTDLTFEGIAGRTSYGFVIASDTTVQTVGRALSDIYGFSWCDTGSGFFFKQAAHGDLFAIDAAFDTPDIVERDQPVMSQDEANIRTPSSVEMQYVSKEGQYKSRPASFNMTTGVLNSITTPKFSTPILFNDAEAQRVVQEKFFEFQEKRRSHTLAVAPENITLLPGDIVSFPSGSRTYITRVEEIGIDLRNMGVEISARDFQTDVESPITATSNTGPVWQVVHYAIGDVTGQALAVSVGTVTVTAAAAGAAFAAITGQAATVSVGTVTVAVTTAVSASPTGQAMTVSVGSVTIPSPPITFDPRPLVSSTSNAAGYTFSGADIGAANASRIVAVGITLSYSASASSISTVTIGGISATISAQVNAGLNCAAVAYAAVPTGTTATIVVTPGTTGARCTVKPYRIIPNVSTPLDSGTTTGGAPGTFQVADVAVESGGALFVAATTGNTTASASYTGIDTLTETDNALHESTRYMHASCATTETASTNDVGAVSGGSSLAVAAMSWH